MHLDILANLLLLCGEIVETIECIIFNINCIKTNTKTLLTTYIVVVFLELISCHPSLWAHCLTFHTAKKFIEVGCRNGTQILDQHLKSSILSPCSNANEAFAIYSSHGPTTSQTHLENDLQIMHRCAPSPPSLSSRMNVP